MSKRGKKQNDQRRAAKSRGNPAAVMGQSDQQALVLAAQQIGRAVDDYLANNGDFAGKIACWAAVGDNLAFVAVDPASREPAVYFNKLADGFDLQQVAFELALFAHASKVKNTHWASISNRIQHWGHVAADGKQIQWAAPPSA